LDLHEGEADVIYTHSKQTKLHTTIIIVLTKIQEVNALFGRIFRSIKRHDAGIHYRILWYWSFTGVMHL
jgi:hypothetical protein